MFCQRVVRAVLDVGFTVSIPGCRLSEALRLLPPAACRIPSLKTSAVRPHPFNASHFLQFPYLDAAFTEAMQQLPPGASAFHGQRVLCCRLMELDIECGCFSQFPYLGAAFSEALRLLPPAGLGTIREAREDFQVCGYTIRKGWWMNVRFCQSG